MYSKPRRRQFLGAGLQATAAGGIWAGLGAPGRWVGQAHAQGNGSDLRALVARARPSVLPVGTYSATASPRFGFRGSGFVVDNGNFVVTNVHVLPAAEPDAGASGGSRLAVLALSAAPGREAGDLRFASLVLQDAVHDLALLRIDGPALPPLPLARGDAVAEGAPIALMGFPVGGALGFSPVTHRGIVASVTTVALPAPTAAQLDPRAVARLRAGNFEVLQLDATAYPGNSGGRCSMPAAARSSAPSTWCWCAAAARRRSPRPPASAMRYRCATCVHCWPKRALQQARRVERATSARHVGAPCGVQTL